MKTPGMWILAWPLPLVFALVFEAPLAAAKDKPKDSFEISGYAARTADEPASRAVIQLSLFEIARPAAPAIHANG